MLGGIGDERIFKIQTGQGIRGPEKLILENPDLPLVVLVADDACCGEFSWTFCGSISFSIDEILDCDYVDSDDTVFTDRTRLEEAI